jgi:hypothetical protein
MFFLKGSYACVRRKYLRVFEIACAWKEQPHFKFVLRRMKMWI